MQLCLATQPCYPAANLAAPSRYPATLPRYPVSQESFHRICSHVSGLPLRHDQGRRVIAHFTFGIDLVPSAKGSTYLFDIPFKTWRKQMHQGVLQIWKGDKRFKVQPWVHLNAIKVAALSMKKRPTEQDLTRLCGSLQRKLAEGSDLAISNIPSNDMDGRARTTVIRNVKNVLDTIETLFVPWLSTFAFLLACKYSGIASVHMTHAGMPRLPLWLPPEEHTRQKVMQAGPHQPHFFRAIDMNQGSFSLNRLLCTNVYVIISMLR